MSLGLDDLTKRRRKSDANTGAKDLAKKLATKRAKEAAKTSSEASKEQPIAKVWTRTQTARPWSGTSLTKASRSRKKDLPKDAAMNEEWVSLHAPPIFWVEIPPESRLHCLQEKLAALEDRVQRAIAGPLLLMRNLYRLQK